MNTFGTNNANSPVRTIVLVLLAVVVAAVGIYAVYTWNRAVTLSAYNDCANASTYTVKQGNATISYPVSDVYQKCLDRVTK